MRFKTLSALALTFALGTAAFAGTPKPGETAPAFTLNDQTGKPVKLSDYAGKIVVLEWFNDGCPFVKKHYTGGNMNAVAAKYAEKGVVWLAINSTKSASTGHNASVASEWKVNRPILDDHTGTVGHEYGATNTPQMFVIDASGKVVYSGAIDSKPSAEESDVAGSTNYVAAALDDLLAGKPVSNSETKPYGCTVKYAK